MVTLGRKFSQLGLQIMRHFKRTKHGNEYQGEDVYRKLNQINLRPHDASVLHVPEKVILTQTLSIVAERAHTACAAVAVST